MRDADAFGMMAGQEMSPGKLLISADLSILFPLCGYRSRFLLTVYILVFSSPSHTQFYLSLFLHQIPFSLPSHHLIDKSTAVPSSP